MLRSVIQGALIAVSVAGLSACGGGDSSDLFGAPATEDTDGTSGDETSDGSRSGDSVGVTSAPDAGPGGDTSDESSVGTESTDTEPSEETSETSTGVGTGTEPSDTTDEGSTDEQSSGEGWVETCAVSFENLSNGAVLRASDDSQGLCADGIQYAIELSVEAPDGQLARLQIGATESLETEVDGGKVVFDVTLPAMQSVTVRASVPGAPGCAAALDVTGECFDPLRCEITYPTKELLNGVPAPAGDRVNSEGLPFRSRVEVATNAANGELVLLQVDGSAGLAGVVANGRAVFSSVELAPDGLHSLQAVCYGDGTNAQSEELAIHVDTTPPAVSVGGISPSDGVHFSPEDDLDPSTDVLEFEVCVPVESEDALDLQDSAAENIHISIGSQASKRAAATSGGLPDGDGGCVRLECPGRAPFDLNISVFDEAGNELSHTISGLTCASDLPSIEIVSLADASNDSFDEDPAQFIGRRLLAANAPPGQLKDESAETAGAQHTLVACTDAPAGVARLLAGAHGGPLGERATTGVFTPAQEADDCPTELPYVVRFPEATLPQSSQTSSSVTLTEIVVEVTDDLGETNVSGSVRLWVDTTAPDTYVSGLWEGHTGNTDLADRYSCGSIVFTEEPIDAEVYVANDEYPREASLWLEGSDEEHRLTSGTTPVQFTLGLGYNTFTSRATDAAGNVTESSCTYFIGDPPIVTWLAPTTDIRVLNAAESPASPTSLPDADPDQDGWQGVLQVEVTNLEAEEIETASVRFLINGVQLAEPIALLGAPQGSEGETSRLITVDLAAESLAIPEGQDVTVVADVVEANDPAQASLRRLLVDVTRPENPKDVVPQVGPNPADRRQTRFQLTWVAPNDGENESVGGYDIVYSKQPIVDLAAFQAGTTVAFNTTPGAPGSAESVTVSNLTIETVYYFAVRAVDAAGNQSDIAQAVAEGPDSPGLAARFRVLQLDPPNGDPGARFGHHMDGSTDLTGDGLSDLLVTSFRSGEAYLFKGEPGGYSSTPLVTIRGNANANFGYSIAVVGDINGDQTGTTPAEVARSQDLVVVENGLGTNAYVIFGRDWEDPSAPALIDLTAGDYDAIIEMQPGSGDAPGDFQFALPSFVSRLGDFNGDGIDDFALAIQYARRADEDSRPGLIAIVLGSTDFASMALRDTSDIGTNVLAIWGMNGSGVYFSRPIVGLPSLGVGSQPTVLVPFGWDPSIIPSEVARFDNRMIDGNMSVGDPLEIWAGPSKFNASAGGLAGYYAPGVLSNGGLAIGSIDGQLNPGEDGVIDVFFAENDRVFANGPAVRFHDSLRSGNFGQVTVGNAFAGRPLGYATSFIGDALNEGGSRDPDLIIGSGRVTVDGSNLPPSLYLIPGTKLRQLSGVIDVASAPEAYAVRYDLAQQINTGEGWRGTLAVPVRDMNGDGFGDIAIAEMHHDTFTPDLNFPGRVIVLY